MKYIYTGTLDEDFNFGFACAFILLIVFTIMATVSQQMMFDAGEQACRSRKGKGLHHINTGSNVAVCNSGLRVNIY